MKLYNSTRGIIVETAAGHFQIANVHWDALFNIPDLSDFLKTQLPSARRMGEPEADALLPPLEGQEVWAAGVTYARSKSARMEESQASGGGDFYDRVYDAERPEIFFKATRHRVVGPHQAVRIRQDSSWSVPEPELGLAVNAFGDIIGYTIGNDVSARDIEGENPLYLPQAKVYDQCCALGPGLLLGPDRLPSTTRIEITIERDGERVFDEGTPLSQLRRPLEELVAYLFRDNSFPLGCIFLTGTGIVPPDAFALQAGDLVSITIAPIGTLTNRVVSSKERTT